MSRFTSEANRFAKRTAHLLPRPVLSRAHHVWWNSIQSTGVRNVLNRTGISPFRLTELKKHKKSDTLFVLGSGGSVNEISDKRWKTIECHDTFGFNFWLFHRHVPTFYAMENVLPALLDAYVSALRPAHFEMPALFTARNPKDLFPLFERLPRKWFKNIRIAPTSSSVVKNETDLRSSLACLNKAGYFNGSDNPRHIYKYRASLTMLLTLGIRLGYKRIILCGIDLNRSDYFFESHQYPRAMGFINPNTKKKHETLISKKYLLPISQVVYSINDVVLKPRGVELYCENSKSELVPRVPAFSDELL